MRQIRTSIPEHDAGEADRFIAAVAAYEREQRLTAIRWAAVICSCAIRYEPGAAPQSGCQVHGSVLIGPDGEILQ